MAAVYGTERWVVNADDVDVVHRLGTAMQEASLIRTKVLQPPIHPTSERISVAALLVSMGSPRLPDRALAARGALKVMALNTYFFFDVGAVPEGGPALPSTDCGVGAAAASGTGGPAAARPTLRPNSRHWPSTGW